jgi:hypothetical protein
LSLPAALTFTGKTVTGGTFTGGTINNTSVGATTPATGAFTAFTTGTGQITTAPSSANDLVNKSYVDSIAAGLTFHAACNLATTAALATVTYSNGSSGVGATLTASSNGALTVDSVAATVGNRILVKDQASALQNGVYTVTTVGDGSTPFLLTRATDMNTSGSGYNQINAGNYFLITAGTVNTNTSWVQTTALPITVGTTSLVFSQFSSGATAYTAGTGLSLLTNQFSISSTAVTAGSYGSGSQVPTFAVNARGQLTSATNTSIAIAGSQITSGTVAIVNGGTGTNSQQGAINALAGAVTSGSYLRGNGTNVSMSTIQAADVPTLNQNTTGNAANVTGTVAIANGGTGQNSKANAFNALSPITTTGDLVIGTGTNVSGRLPISATVGHVLTSTGTTASWQAPSGGGVSSFQTSLSGLTPNTATTGAVTLAGTLGVASGGTGATTLTGIIKGSGTSAFSAATAGTDYLAPPSGTSILKANSGGALANAVAGTDYQAPITLTTTGTSGAATFVGNTLNIPQYSGGGGGGVSSVTATSPVASSGGATPDISLSANYGDTLNPYASKTANYVLAAPNGSSGVPTFRAIVAADIPTLNQNTSGTAAGLSTTLAVASGGTGLTATPTNGQIDIGNGTGFTRTTLTAGSNITITNGAGSITIASTGGGSSGPVLESYQTISSNYSVTAGSNAFSVGPISVATGVAVTVPTGQVWLIAA